MDEWDKVEWHLGVEPNWFKWRYLIWTIPVVFKTRVKGTYQYQIDKNKDVVTPARLRNKWVGTWLCQKGRHLTKNHLDLFRNFQCDFF